MAYKKRIRITVGHTYDGEPIRKSFYGKSVKECNEKIDAYKLEVATEKKQEWDETLFESWADKWLNIYKENIVSDSTYYGYKLCIDHLNDYFGDYNIRMIRAIDIQQFFKTKAEFSQSMVDKIRITLNAIFETAIENDLFIKNPMANIKPKGKPALEKQPYTIDEYEVVVKYAMTHPEGLGAFIILKTGIRKGELMGLNPAKDIDFVKRLLSVNRVITDDTGTPKMKTTGKSEKALRVIPLDDVFCDFLKNDIRMYRDDYLFKTHHGKIMGPRVWANYHYKKYTDDLKIAHPELPLLSPHELRHTYGTILYKFGTDVFTLQKLLGHASIETTTKIYVHDDVEDLVKNIRWKIVPVEEDPGKIVAT
ncbi:tyrosine-type recombinase/integrase [Acetobacterium sp.]|uniref:tyrosine-type recombinase/integrase n=1 Tax=Acetobacterium sp. TaxID=1872094 RepID=UPI002F3E881F